MIDMEYTQEITDTIHGAITYSGIEREIIGTPYFNRLHRILQSSLVYLTYPSNKVKRFEHSVGTMHMAGKFFSQSICNTPCDVLEKFFSEINEELLKWNKELKRADVSFIHPTVLARFKNDKILEAPYPKNPLYYMNTPANLPTEYSFSYYVVYQAIRLVGLLHDIGHLPYSHVLEHAFRLLYQKVLEIPDTDKKESHLYFLEIMKKYCDNSGFEIHEELGRRFVDKIFTSITDDLQKGENSEVYFLAAVFYFTKQILDSEEGTSNNTIFGDLHRIVAGTIDCDRMDYCCRDAYCAGVTKELPNYSRITSSLQIIYRAPEAPLVYPDAAPTKERSSCYFAPSTKAISQIEHLLEQRWSIFISINYHHRVHKHELLMQRAIAELGLQEMESGTKPNELENILPLQISSIWQLINQLENAAPIEYIALQLDDSWLDTLLKHKYFDVYGENYLSFASNNDDINWHRLDELISTKKHYYSLIKRSGGFRNLDEPLYNKLKELGYLEDWNIVSQGESPNYTQFLNKGEYVFNKLIRLNASTADERKKFFLDLEARLKSALVGTGYNIADCFLDECAFKPGISQSDPLFITSPEVSVKPFSHYSPLYDILMTRKKLLPSLHVYYLPSYDVTHNEYYTPQIDDFRALLVDSIVNLLKDMKVSESTKTVEDVNAAKESCELDKKEAVK